MIWNDEFMAALKFGAYYGTHTFKYRLLVGSPAVVHGSCMGDWERMHAQVVELTSHPDCASYPSGVSSADLIAGEGVWPLTSFTGGAPGEGPIQYIYGVGLSNPISMGAARVHPRTFEYTGATLTCGLTPWGAKVLSRLAIGNFARLQVLPDLKEESSKAHTHTMDISGLDAAPWRAQWTDVFIGVYQGMRTDGVKSTANFTPALEGAKMKRNVIKGFGSTADIEKVRTPEAYRWWQGCGAQMKLKATITPALISGEDRMTIGHPYLDYPFGEGEELDGRPVTGAKYQAWGDSYKRTIVATGIDDVCFGAGSGAHDDFYYADLTTATSLDYYNWAMVKDSEGKTSFITYEEASSTTATQLTRAGSDSDNPPPGFTGFEVGGEDSTSFGAGTVLQAVCVVHGTPVTELVNTVYVIGYGRKMTAGIFGTSWAQHSYADTEWDPLNVEDIQHNHNLWNSRYAHSTSEVWDLVRNAPFRTTFIKSSTNGLGDMTKLTGKWGVFPRFKNGGWSVCTVQGNNSGSTPLYNDVEAFITERHIESFEWSKREQDSAGVYNAIEYISTDYDYTLSHPYSGYDVGNYGRAKSLGKKVPGSYIMESGLEDVGTNWPQLSTLTVTTSDCAMGFEAGKQFRDYHYKYLATDFFFVPREECTVRLRGMAFGHVEPGDYVHIVIPNPVTPYGFKGPGGGGTNQHLLDSSNLDGDLASLPHVDDIKAEIASDQRAHPWFCTSAQKDWINGRVTLTLSRPTLAKPNEIGELSVNSVQLGLPDPLYHPWRWLDYTMG